MIRYAIFKEDELSLVDRLILRYFEDGFFLLVTGDTDAHIDMINARDEYYARHSDEAYSITDEDTSSKENSKEEFNK